MRKCKLNAEGKENNNGEHTLNRKKKVQSSSAKSDLLETAI